nr:hypothetical protein [uncultured Albidiferax sp.]
MGEARRRKLMAASSAGAAVGPTSDGVWPISDAVAQQQLESWFAERGIDCSKPGIHDSPEFLHAEARDPKALNQVARWVEARSYSGEELACAERKIRIAADAMSNRIARDGRLGLCVVASGILSRMLDELGVWNYTAKSNLTVHFPRSVSPEPRHFYSIDYGNFEAPHAIVVAPPFTVIDLTVKHQSYDEPALSRWLPVQVATKQFLPYRLPLSELLAPEVRSQLQLQRLPVERFLALNRPHMLELMKHLPSREVALDGGRLGYGLVAVGGYQERLRDLHGSNCSIDGMTPAQIYDQDVLPKL